MTIPSIPKSREREFCDYCDNILNKIYIRYCGAEKVRSALYLSVASPILSDISTYFSCQEKERRLSNIECLIIASLYGDVASIAYQFGDVNTFNTAYITEQKWLSRANFRSLNMFPWIIREFWGITSLYGTRPSRFAFVLTTVIIVFGLFYSTTYLSYSDIPHLEIKDVNYPNGYCTFFEALLNSIYFSIITLTTVGFGDIIPNNSYARLIVPIEALLGVSLFGVFVAMLTRKKPYRKLSSFLLQNDLTKDIN